MPSEKRKARKQNYFKAAKQSRKVQEESPRKTLLPFFDNNGRGHENIFDMKYFLFMVSYYKTIKAAKQSRKVQEVSPRKNIIGNKGVLKQQKGKPLLAMQCLKTIIYINVLKQRA